VLVLCKLNADKEGDVSFIQLPVGLVYYMQLVEGLKSWIVIIENWDNLRETLFIYLGFGVLLLVAPSH
jgi:hypothetical protein